MKKLKTTILLILSVLVLVFAITVIAYKKPYEFNKQLYLYDPTYDESMITDYSIQEKPYFFTYSITSVLWKNELGIFFNSLEDDEIIFKKMHNKFHSELRTYPLSRDGAVQPNVENVPNFIHVQQYENEFQFSYMVKNEKGFWVTRQFYGPAKNEEEALGIRERLLEHGAEPNPLD